MSSQHQNKLFLWSRSLSFTIANSLRDFTFSHPVPVHTPIHRRDDDHRTVDDTGVSWSTMLPELLEQIIRRLDDSEYQWPQRRNVVVFACVCRRWRQVAKNIVTSPFHSGTITFPSCLKLPAPRELPLQCLVKRDEKNGTFRLFLALTPSFTDKGKFLLAARRHRHVAGREYIISLDAHDLSQGSNAYVGKISSDFFGTNFTIYDSKPPHSGAKPSSSRGGFRFASRQISPQVPAQNFEVGQILYKYYGKSGTPNRRMTCLLNCPCSDGTAAHRPQDDFNKKMPESAAFGQTSLINKLPTCLQCRFMCFHGRATIASETNFQLVATSDQSQPGGEGDEETVLLLFGKVGQASVDEDQFFSFRGSLIGVSPFVCIDVKVLSNSASEFSHDYWDMNGSKTPKSQRPPECSRDLDLLVADIQALSFQVGIISIEYKPRSTNEVAHLIAKISQVIKFEDLPDHISTRQVGHITVPSWLQVP
ncbi:Tubby-like F-box protein [Heracleum sosnowskyi]|uniref:Tubby-like F-box protein n=1 Tax=Heracleum sosnowskyi TaxID=360622 RepID=A0AAD8NEC8_9APIA|nr:Tubby-like F-box protein [Heracleum sosnowskyi]